MQKYIGIYWDAEKRCCEQIDIFSNDLLDAFTKLQNAIGDNDKALEVQLVER